MGDTFVISGLVAKRAEILGLVQSLEGRIKQARINLAHIDAAILIFDPDAKPTAIRGRKAHERSGWFDPGEKSRFIRETLRTASEPISGEDVARAFMHAKGMVQEDKTARQKMIQSFLSTLGRMASRGLGVQKIGHGLGARWTLST